MQHNQNLPTEAPSNATDDQINEVYFNANLLSKKYTAAVTMKVDRYASSITENDIHLTNDAVQLLLREEYLNFFMACGPNYVRSLHRAQEVTAIFAFEAIERDAAVAFVKALKSYVNGVSTANNNIKQKHHTLHEHDKHDHPHQPEFKLPNDDEGDFTHILNTLSIEISAYGLGLNKNGKEALVATSLDEFNQVMKFALDSMINFPSNKEKINRNGILISTLELGVIHEMEVAPWVDNAEFLNYARVDPEYIKMPVKHWAIEESRIVNGHRKCSRSYLTIDSYDKCCQEQDLDFFYAKDENGDVVQKRRCANMKYLSPAVLSKNIQMNAEFVTRLGAAAQHKIKSLSNLGQCVNTLRSFPERFDYHFLRNADAAVYNHKTELRYTTKVIKAALDPTGDLGILTMLGIENDEYFEMFYQPCMAALQGMNLGLDKNIDAKYFMAQPWYEHPECNRPSCLGTNMAWDRVNGNDCVEGILGRKNTRNPIPSQNDSFCATTMNVTSGTEMCRHSPDSDTIRQMDNCRRLLSQMKDGGDLLTTNPVPLSYFLDQFCMPQLAMDVQPASSLEDMDTIDSTWATCSQGVASNTKCVVDKPVNLGDGYCDGGQYNKFDCGWDHGDCLDFNKQYPNCRAPSPFLVGNGLCDGKAYNNEACDFDGGDCNDFNSLYSNCNVKHPYLIGNGFCDGHEYDVEECGYDGGDCDVLNSK